MTFPWNGFPAGLFRGFFFTPPPLAMGSPLWNGFVRCGDCNPVRGAAQATSTGAAGPRTRSVALVERQVPTPVLPLVDLIRPVELVLLQLLEPVSQPACDPGHGKDRGERVAGDAHLVIDDARVEVHVGVHLLVCQQL